jgi:2-ketocyclohexanecarboxyl-CoA hydrolase
LRFHHRLGKGRVRPSRPEGRLGRSRLRHRLSSARGGGKKAREIWYLCRRYTAQEALSFGLVNAVVPHDQLDAEVGRWCAEILERSPTAIAIAKRSFNADSANIGGIGGLGMQALSLYYDTEESREGVAAFKEKRKPEFRKFYK